MTNIIHDLYVGSEFTVDVCPVDDDHGGAMFGGATILIRFDNPGSGYGINTELMMGADDWRQWRQAVDDALRDAACEPARGPAVVIPFKPR